MPTSHPRRDGRDQLRYNRHRRTWISTGVLFALVVALGVFVAVNAGRWGVPLFSFTNEYDSPCRNDWLGYTCTDLTRADLERHLGMQLPGGASILSSEWKQTHDYELKARLLYPQAVAKEGWEALTERFGACREGLPSPLSEVPDLSGLCVMSNQSGGEPGTEPSPQVWRIATATQADGDTVVDIHLRSR